MKFDINILNMEIIMTTSTNAKDGVTQNVTKAGITWGAELIALSAITIC